ncbi:MAG TPA: insulinase family protein, partial [Fibrella sp.]
VRIRQKEGIRYGVGSQVCANSLDKSGSFMTYAMYNPENTDRLDKAFREELEKIRTEGFTAEEVKAAKSGFLQSRQVTRAQDPSLASTLNNYLFLNRTMAFDADLDKKIDALTPETINAAVKKHIDPSKLITVRAGDFMKAKKTVADKQPPAAVGSGKKD